MSDALFQHPLLPEYKKETQIVYHLSINTFNQIKEILEIFINKNGGITKAKVKEVSLFSHGGQFMVLQPQTL